MKRVFSQAWTRSFVSLLCLVATASAAPDFFVAPYGNDVTGTGLIDSPFATLERARQAVAAVNATMTSDLRVNIRSGTYSLTAPVVFRTSDSGTNGFNVMYQAYNNEKPVFSGGVRITNWTDAGGGVYTANTGTLAFRQLYVNGRRAVRARTPNAGTYNRLITWNSDYTISVREAEVSTIENFGAVEFVAARIWNQNRLRVSSSVVSGSTANLSFLDPESTIAFASLPPWAKQNQIYYLENALSFLDAEDEWFLDRASGTLYYKPVAGEPISASTFIAPVVETLVDLKGDSLDSPVHHIQFMGLTFAHTAWNEVDTRGYVGQQAGFVRMSTVQSAVSAITKSGVVANNADNLRFEKNTFEHMGGQALTLFSACHQNTIVGNRVHDIAGNGISVDMAVNKSPTDPRLTSSDNNLFNNYVWDCAVEYWGSVGIFGGYVKNTRIEHNEVAYLPYTGVSVGWGWTVNDNPAMNNSIQYNHIHHVMTLLQDGAAIYTLSKQPGTIIANNYIHDIKRSPWTEAPRVPIAGIYLDNGSSLISATSNLILPVEQRVFDHIVFPEQQNTIADNDRLIPEVLHNSGPQLAYRPSPVGAQLVGWWTMEDAAAGAVADLSGFGNNGVITGGVASVVPGICGSAIRLDGVARVTVPDDPSLRVQRFTISAWIKPDVSLSEMAGLPMVVSKRKRNNGYLLGTISDSTNLLGVRFYSATTQQISYNEDTSLNWVHVAATYDGTLLRLYRNGVLENQLAVTSTVIKHDGASLLIGDRFRGLIDDVRIYDDALSESDVQSFVDIKLDTSLAGRWRMDEGHPTFLSDVSGNKNFGLINPAVTQWVEGQDGQYYLSFNGGATHAVTAPDSASLRVQNYTISVWIQPAKAFNTMAYPYPILASKQDYPATAGYHLGVLYPASTTLGNRILTGATGVKQTTYSEPAYGGWIHVAGSYDGNALRIYKNGVMQSEVVTGPLTIEHTTNQFLIGYGFEGIMRDLRIYNRALTDAEVESLGP